MPRRLRPLLLLAALWLAPVSGAWAHAALLGSEPEDGASLAAPPAALVLRFDEAVTLLDLRLTGPSGAVALAAPAGTSGTVLRAALPAGLPRGTYLAGYRVVSADGHPVGGTLAFGLGMAPEPAAAAPAPDPPWTAAATLLRLLLYLGVALGGGGALFAALVAAPPPAARRVSRLAAAAGAVAALLGIGVQGADLRAAPDLAALLEGASWDAAAASTALARGLAVASGLLLALLALGRTGRAARLAGLAGALLAAGGLALSGHAAQGGPPVQALLVAHALTAAFWLGAFPPLAALLRRDGAAALPAVRRFAALALPAVAVLLLTGVAQAALHLPEATALVRTRYGGLLLAKAGLALLLLALAGWNNRVLTPALAADRPGTAGRLRRAIGLEGGLALLLLGVTAVLTMTPPRPAEPHRHPHAAVAEGLAVATEAGGRSVTLQASPARVGHNRLRLWIAGPDGLPFAAREVTLELVPPRSRTDGLRRPMQAAGPGVFTWEGPELALPGRWTLHVDILVGDFEQATATLTLPVGP